MPRCVVDRPLASTGRATTPPRIPLDETVVYEVHVKGFTQQHPDVPEEIRGTYAGLAHPAAIKHLTDLGVTAVELLPVHQFVQDSTSQEKGLRNYWGYNSHRLLRAARRLQLASGDGGRQVDEFKAMVKALHAAGLEVILDVVYNHTAEGNHMGPTLSFKGIDNASYYRLVEGDEAHYFDTTGTGNSLNVGHPAALGLIMDSLRYWVTEMHVDGFRFDLATTLTRQDGDAEMHSAFLDLMPPGPGARAGQDDRRAVGHRGLPGRRLPGRLVGVERQVPRRRARVLAGAGDVLGDVRRSASSAARTSTRPTAARRCRSVNFVTAHDGFTLRRPDLVRREAQRGQRRGQQRRRERQHVVQRRRRGPDRRRGRATTTATASAATSSATLLLSAGVPMILGGDEIGRTQGGNNNAYCQDDEISWFDWATADRDLLDFTRKLIRCVAATRRCVPSGSAATTSRVPRRPCASSAPTARR